MDMYNYDDPENHVHLDEDQSKPSEANMRVMLYCLHMTVLDILLALDGQLPWHGEMSNLLRLLQGATNALKKTLGDDPGRVGSGDPGDCDSPAVRLLLRTPGTACLLGRNRRERTAGSPGLGHGTDKRSGSSTNDAAHNIV